MKKFRITINGTTYEKTLQTKYHALLYAMLVMAQNKNTTLELNITLLLNDGKEHNNLNFKGMRRHFCVAVAKWHDEINMLIDSELRCIGKPQSIYSKAEIAELIYCKLNFANYLFNVMDMSIITANRDLHKLFIWTSSCKPYKIVLITDEHCIGFQALDNDNKLICRHMLYKDNIITYVPMETQILRYFGIKA